jgi:hypothetical protein
MTATTMDPTIERPDLPAIPALDGAPIDQWDTYAVIHCGEVRAEIVRFSYWHPNDGVDSVEVSFDARLHVPDVGVGLANIHSDDTHKLHCVAQVAKRAAFLVEEARRRYATWAAATRASVTYEAPA